MSNFFMSDDNLCSINSSFVSPQDFNHQSITLFITLPSITVAAWGLFEFIPLVIRLVESHSDMNHIPPPDACLN